jgi:hypothetical protein
VHIHGVLRTIVFDREMKFMSYFWKMLWGKVGDEALIQHYMSSTNICLERGGEHDIIGALEIDD